MLCQQERRYDSGDHVPTVLGVYNSSSTYFCRCCRQGEGSRARLFTEPSVRGWGELCARANPFLGAAGKARESTPCPRQKTLGGSQKKRYGRVCVPVDFTRYPLSSVLFCSPHSGVFLARRTESGRMASRALTAVVFAFAPCSGFVAPVQLGNAGEMKNLMSLSTCFWRVLFLCVVFPGVRCLCLCRSACSIPESSS